MNIGLLLIFIFSLGKVSLEVIFNLEDIEYLYFMVCYDGIYIFSCIVREYEVVIVEVERLLLF